MARNLVWVLGLLFISIREFILALRELGTAAYLAPACRAHGTEWIHVHFASRCLSAGVMLARLVGVPVSCTVHAFDLWTRSGRNLRYRLKDCRFIVAISRYNVNYLREVSGADIADRCRVIHCGIDLTRFGTAVRSPVPGRIVIVSALTPKKGHCYLLKACAILKKRKVPHECIIIGGGPLYEDIRRQVEALRLQDCVRLIGPLANDEIGPYLTSAAVFALPAIVAENGDRDGIPVALMEAMACGIPVVSTAVSGIPELLHEGEAGCVVPEKDPESLADALARLLSDGDLARQFAEAGREVVAREFDIRKTSAELRALFSEGIDRPAPSRRRTG